MITSMPCGGRAWEGGGQGGRGYMTLRSCRIRLIGAFDVLWLLSGSSTLTPI